MMRRAFVLAFLTLSSCNDLSAGILKNMSCKSIADQVVGISDGELVSLDKRVLTSRSDDRVVCHGNGFYSDGSEVPTRFEAFINGDGEMLLRYDIKEYTAEQERQAEAKANQEAQAAKEEFNREYDQTLSDIKESLE